MSLQNINVLYGVTTLEAHLSLIKPTFHIPRFRPILGPTRHQSAFGQPAKLPSMGRRRRTQSGGSRTEYTAPRRRRPSFFDRSWSESWSWERRTIIIIHQLNNAIFDFGQLVARRHTCALCRRSAVPVAGVSESRTSPFYNRQCCPRERSNARAAIPPRPTTP